MTQHNTRTSPMNPIVPPLFFLLVTTTILVSVGAFQTSLPTHRIPRTQSYHHPQRRSKPTPPSNQHYRITPFLPQTLFVPHPILSSGSTTSTTTVASTTTGGGTTDDGTNDSTCVRFGGNGDFDLATALFCGGLAFDSYTEPPKDSSRWERGSSGLNVAFQSRSYTRSLYSGLLRLTPISCSDLPTEGAENTSGVEKIVSGSNVDACVLIAVVEGKWTEDIRTIETDRYHDGVRSLQGCAHVGRSSTAWGNISEKQADKKRAKGGSGAYHEEGNWWMGKGGKAVWKGDPPFYLYVQDPTEARLVFTIVDDDVVGEGTTVGSTSKKLVELIPGVGKGLADVVKEKVRQRMMEGGEGSAMDVDGMMKEVMEKGLNWEGTLKMTSKPRKKDKNGQVMAAAAAGAMVAGPAGAAVGGALAKMYESDPQGKLQVNISYLPIEVNPTERKQYKFKGGTPGLDWGNLYETLLKKNDANAQPLRHLGGNDFEFCFFVNHDATGCSCAVYRSLEERRIVISFRGTCELTDLITDASIVQEPWIAGVDQEKKDVEKVHLGFRKSLQSISRRLKELILATVAPGEDISSYDLVVTGHSLGAALATLFTADVGEYGIDAGRGLPRLSPSEPWWSFLKGNQGGSESAPPPPRPKTLRMYNFGSPRVGNEAFVRLFEGLVGNGIDEAYRIVNGMDVVARLPRTVDLLSIGYDHCAPTVLISTPEGKTDGEDGGPLPSIWIEGADEGECPVRDGTALTGPLAKGSLIGDIVSAVRKETKGGEIPEPSASKDTGGGRGGLLPIVERLKSFTAADIPSIVGVDKKFVERESKIVRAIFSGEALGHHMEDEYYVGMGRACGLEGVELEIGLIKNDVDKA